VKAKLEDWLRTRLFSRTHIFLLSGRFTSDLQIIWAKIFVFANAVLIPLFFISKNVCSNYILNIFIKIFSIAGISF